MADDKIKLGLEVDIQVERLKQLADLDKRINSLNEKVEAGDAKAIKAAEALNKQKRTLIAQINAETAAIEAKTAAERQAAAEKAKADKAAEKAARKKEAAERAVAKEVEKAAKQKKKDDDAALARQNESRRLTLQERQEARQAARERRIAAGEAEGAVKRVQKAKERATYSSINGYRRLAKAKASQDKTAVDGIVKMAKARRKASVEQIQNMGRRLRMALTSQGVEAALERTRAQATAASIRGFRALAGTQARNQRAEVRSFLKFSSLSERIRQRAERRAERAAALEKRTNDARLRNEASAANHQRGMQQYLQRHLAMSQFQGKLQQRNGREAIRELRSRTQTAQTLYNFQMNAAKQSGKWDAQAEQRIQNQYSNEIKAARRAFTTKMALGREEQREYDRRMGSARRNISRGAGRMRDGFGEARSSVNGIGAAALATGAVVAAAIDRGIQSRMSIDTAETKLRMFGGMGTEKMSQAEVVQTRKDWLDKAAIKNGLAPSSAINAYTEVLKADIPKAISKDVTQMILEGVAGADMPLDETTKLVSRLNYLKPQLGVSGLKRGLNDVSVAAAVTGADSNEIVSSLRRGAGALTESPSLNFGQLAALTGVGISTGIQEGQAGTFIEHQLRHAATAKYQGKQRRTELARGYRMLGMGSLSEVQKQAADDGAGFLQKMFTALNQLAKTDIKKANKAADFIGGEYWTKAMMMFAAAADPHNNKITNALDAVKNDGGNHLDKSNEEKINSWQGMWNSTKTVFSLFMDDFGGGFNEIYRSVNSFIRDFGGKFDRGSIGRGVQAALDGIKNGLGLDSWKQGLQKIFGDGSQTMTIQNANTIRKFATGFTEGVVGIVDGIKSMAQAFGINTGDPKALGRLAGQIATLSIALLALTPVIGVITGVIGLFKGIAGLGQMFLGLGAFGKTLAKNPMFGGRLAAAGSGLAGLTGWAGIGLAIGSALIDYVVPRIGAKIREWLGPGMMSNGVKEAEASIVGGQDNFVGRASTWILDLFRSRPQAHANGGYVSGPGGPRSDSIAARLSNGEFVVNAAATRQHRGLLEAINGGQGFALGGMVGNGTSPFMGSGIGSRGDDVKRLADGIDELVRLMRIEQRDRWLNEPVGSGRGGGGRNMRYGAGGGGGTRGGDFYNSYAGGGADGSTGGGYGGRRRGGMGHGGLGGSVPGGDFGGSTRARGNLAANQQSAYQAAIANGLNPTAARALVANMSGESLRNPSDHHWDRTHMSQGIVQWDPQRAAAIQRQFGKLPKDMSVPEQVKAALWEMKTNKAYAPTWRALQGNDPKAMLGQLVGNYERPQNKQKAYNERMGYYNGFNPGGGSAPGTSGPVPGGVADNTLSRMQALKSSGQVIGQQCVALAKAAVGVGGSVKEWQRGVGADQGTLKPGTPVATFLNRDGSQSNRYAGGGTGTMGANRDHAGVFQEYIRDKNGKITGMRIAEQYAGSGGVKSKAYMFGQGYGEKNGSNYAAILGPDGRPLGGGRNPMAQAQAAAAQVQTQARAAATNATAMSAQPKPKDPVITGSIGGAPVLPDAGKAVDIGMKARGMREVETGKILGYKQTMDQWCSDFVNGSLQAAGLKGSGNSVASAFKNFGQAVDMTPEALKKGDVLLKHRGKKAGEVGAHAGLYTGQSRRNAKGELEVEMLGGDTYRRDENGIPLAKDGKPYYASDYAKKMGQAYSGKDDAVRPGAQADYVVDKGWYAAKDLIARRATQALGGMGKSAPLGTNAPIRANAGTAGAAPQQQASASNIQIHINGHNKDPKELASEVQRSLQNDMNRRTHDYDGFA